MDNIKKEGKMFSNKKDLIKRISEKNGDLAELFEKFFNTLTEIATEVEPLQIDRDALEQQIKNRKKRNIYEDLNNAIDQVTDRIGEINIIPGKPGSCHSLCVSKSFGKWNSRKDGFKGIAEKTISYWLNCNIKNKATLIFTSAWDSIDFNENFRTTFDAQTSNSDKTVCVILVTTSGFSIQYLG